MRRDFLHRCLNFVKGRRALSLLIVALFFALLGLVVTPRQSSLYREGIRLQRVVQKRQAVLEKFALQAMALPDTAWIEFKGFPSDMVLYRYRADTLQSWINQYPISNDELGIRDPFYYRFSRQHYLDGQNRNIRWFSNLSSQSQYINIGTSWYVIKLYSEGDKKIVAGVLILSNGEISEKLHSPKNILIEPIGAGGDIVIRGADGSTLFSIVEEVSPAVRVSLFHWLSVLFALFALCAFYSKKRTVKRFLCYIAGLSVLWAICFGLGSYMGHNSVVFSPALYADTGLFASFGALLLNNAYVNLFALGIYLLRERIVSCASERRGIAKGILIAIVAIATIALALYANATLRSLVLNSSFVVEPYRVTEMTPYSALCYFSYAFLFLMLMYLGRMLLLLVAPKSARRLSKARGITIYIFIISLYVLLTVVSLSFVKERNWSILATNQLSVERDLDLEMELRTIEERLYRDPVTALIMTQPQENIELLEQRFSEIYFYNIRQRYNINLTICRQGESLQIAQLVVNCQQYYNAILTQYNGVQISDRSNFFYLNNYNGRVGYLGIFRYYTETGPVNLYIEVNSRFIDEPNGYPSELADYHNSDNFAIPTGYSYAKYNEGRLVLYAGGYDYPVYGKDFNSKGDFSVQKKDKYVHFVNKISDNNAVVISRPVRTLFPYIVSFSYLVLFFGAIFFGIMYLRRRFDKKGLRRVDAPRKSLRGQLNSLITAVLVVALVAVCTGSVWYSVNFYKASSRALMKEKIQTVQRALAEYCTYAQDYTDVSSNDLFATMDRLASDTRADINLYDPKGKLIRSTKPELFQRFILSSRMNSKAYSEIVIATKSQVFNRERIGKYSYRSLYAPIYNINGKLIAIANIPYFAKYSNVSGDLSSVVATIINISILLLILSLFLGRLLSTSVTRPISQLSRKMQLISIAEIPEHINYTSDDELGRLVDSYNNMVDSLAESTKRMAQAERENAWKDMARQIAHEIKNTLTPMKLSVQRLINLKERGVPGWEDKVEEISKSLLDQIEILSENSSDFSIIAKVNTEAESLFNLYDVVKEMAVMYDNEGDVRISFGYDSQSCFVLARKGQIANVLSNLLTNAIQAIRRDDADFKGFVRITLRAEGGFYVVSVEDNGDGVKEEDIEKLFNPNFTTKSGGNGMGLAISRNIVEQSGGRIWYGRSELGGSNFSFTLPKKESSS